MTLKSDAKFKEKPTCRFTFKFDMRNLVNFHPNTQKSKNDLITWRIWVNITEECASFEEKLTLGSKNGMRKLVNFNVSSGKS